MRTLGNIALVLLLAFSLGSARVLAQARTPAFRIIVHPSNPEERVDRRFVADVFLKKVTHWNDGQFIHPVDMSPDSPVRQRFSEDVLQRSVGAVKSYWEQLVFSGRGIPPPELAGDPEVVQYVLKHPGAIGYVSPAAAVGGAKVLTLQ